MRVPEDLRGQVMVVPFQGLVDWARKNSMWPVTFGLACCAIEYMAIQNSRFDLSRFGMEINRASPRQADIMIVSGTVTVKMAHAIRRIYDQMADPKYVISMGVCATAGGPYQGSLQHRARRGQLPARRRVRRGVSAAAGRAAVRDHPAAEEDHRSRDRRGPRALASLAARYREIGRPVPDYDPLTISDEDLKALHAGRARRGLQSARRRQAPRVGPHSTAGTAPLQAASCARRQLPRPADCQRSRLQRQQHPRLRARPRLLRQPPLAAAAAPGRSAPAPAPACGAQRAREARGAALRPARPRRSIDGSPGSGATATPR